MGIGVVKSGKWLMGLLYWCSYCAAQGYVWPGALTVPVPDSSVDSAKVVLSSDMTVFGSYEKTHNDLEWRPHYSSVKLQQRGLFETSSDLTSDAMNQYYDLSGSVEKEHVLPEDGSLGLEWTPTSRLNLRQTGSALQITSDFGPIMKWRLDNVPLLLHGGISGTSWSDTLASAIFESSIKQLHGDAGYYGGIEFGDPTRKLFGQPLYVNAEAFGRSIQETGLATITGAALFAADCGTGDSVYAFYGDSLSDGKENIWGNSANQLPFINTPWRIARSMQTAVGFKAKERFGLRPAVMYSYTDNTVSYPNIAQNSNENVNYLSDVEERGQTFDFHLGTIDGTRIIYNGGIKFALGSEEWLFGKDLSTIASADYSRYHVLSKIQLDSLNAKLGNYDKFIVNADNYIGIPLPDSMLLEYKLSAFRDSKTYTFSYRNGADTVRNDNDNDRITINNHCGFKVQNFKAFNFELFGELSEYILNNLRADRSGDNYTRNSYRVGTTFGYKPSERLVLAENIVADAEIEEYLYTQNHQNDPPPYQRRIFSVFTGLWKPADVWEIKGRWNQSYYDNGKWYGREYRDTGRVDYYAIESKTIDYSFELSLAHVRPTSRFEGGCLVQNIYEQQFVDSSYENVNRGIGYSIEPFVEILLKHRHIALKARVARLINTQAQDKWAIRNNWDIHVVGQATW
jgi:hypothetical protein